ncbi:MAG TPA: hypothetical protein VM487_13875 [Phycisphaerae bacterium]|nr:hypothetical protein [Phycisphaerae bacterium]
MPGSCPYCGRPDEDNPSDYYHRKACERMDLLDRLDAAKADGDTEAITKLRRELEAAIYVGD